MANKLESSFEFYSKLFSQQLNFYTDLYLESVDLAKSATDTRFALYKGLASGTKEQTTSSKKK